ncbi:hypothetical protein D917_10447 [Trichinella nativa]|uniref:Uncharacterized protein n=1 Tax=Trichinella nativa TaxID=6335 RepID=A0A1Y3EBQ4_9BILA|nr:hypothetical protein D917_10447 [Trichinella nativa]
MRPWKRHRYKHRYVHCQFSGDVACTHRHVTKAHSVQLREEQRTLQTFLSVLCQQALCTDYAEDCGRKD